MRLKCHGVRDQSFDYKPAGSVFSISDVSDHMVLQCGRVSQISFGVLK